MQPLGNTSRRLPAAVNQGLEVQQNEQSNDGKVLLQELGINSSTSFGLTLSTDSCLTHADTRAMLFEQLTSLKKNALANGEVVTEESRSRLLDNTISALKARFIDAPPVWNREKFKVIANELLNFLQHQPPEMVESLMRVLGFDKTICYDSSKYDGAKNPKGERHGQGKYTFANGDIYEGKWENNKRNGQGKCTFANGDVYEGEWENDNRSGQGTYYIKTNGDKYVGEWKNNKRHGKGKYTFANGNKQESNWENDNPIIVFPNGDKYTGEWKNGKRHGKGKYTFANGDVFEGKFKENLPSNGTMKYANNDIYEGKWENGLLSDGIMKYANLDIYEGKWENGLPSDGIMAYADGDKYTGKWENGKRNGEGTYKSGNLLFSGRWMNNLMHGYGKITTTDGGLIAEGTWNLGCLPPAKIPRSRLYTSDFVEDATKGVMSKAHKICEELMKRADKYEMAVGLPEKIFPHLRGNGLGYVVAIDPCLFNNPTRQYGPNMFNANANDPCDLGGYLRGFALCAHAVAKIPPADLTISNLKDALVLAFPPDYLQLNISNDREVDNPDCLAAKYYELVPRDDTSWNEYGLRYPLEKILNEFCHHGVPSSIVSKYPDEVTINRIFDKYKQRFLDNIESANGDKNNIIAAIVLFISQIENSHFVNNGNTRLSCQILLNKLLVEYKAFPNGFGSILFIPNGFSHFALSHVNHYLEKNNNIQFDDLTVAQLTEALRIPLQWVEQGNQFYQQICDTVKT